MAKKKQWNTIVINSDTLRADHLGCYGHPFIETPRIDAFAERCIQYNNVYMESGPTVQMRRIWFTGQSLLPFPCDLPPKGVYPPLLGWKPLRNEDVSFVETLHENGYRTGLATDVWHFFKPNMNLHRGFDYWFKCGGQEQDGYRTGPVKEVNTKNHIPENLWTTHYDQRLKTFLKNTHDYEEEEYFCARTFRKTAQMAIDFAQEKRPFFIWCDTFVPHEPWDGRKTYWWDRYRDRYNVKSKIAEPIFFYGADMSKITMADNNLFHAVYAGMVSQLDFWFGYLIDALERVGIFENTVVIFTCDHGTEFMEHGEFQKHPHLLHKEVCQLPLLVHHPEFEDKHVEVNGLVSGLDYPPTLLKLAGLKPQAPMEGDDFLQMATGEKKSIRDHCRAGYCHFGSIRTLEWNLIFPVVTAADTKTLDAILPGQAP
ncbi:MAG: sulfatase, partial [Candidatus Sumerlaeota bacterium]|nr:sulfatase [Candidatus Sumerlaeota bacterium]